METKHAGAAPTALTAPRMDACKAPTSRQTKLSHSVTPPDLELLPDFDIILRRLLLTVRSYTPRNPLAAGHSCS